MYACYDVRNHTCAVISTVPSITVDGIIHSKFHNIGSSPVCSHWTAGASRDIDVYDNSVNNISISTAVVAYGAISWYKDKVYSLCTKLGVKT